MTRSQTDNALFRVKICGVTTASDAQLVVQAGGDAIGFNFYAKSKRYIHTDAARAVAAELPSTISKVGVFVNESRETIDEVCRRVGLDAVQLHGDEPASLPAELPGSVAVIRAFRLPADDPSSLSSAADYLRRCGDCGRMPDAVLVDAHMAGSYGGTGRTINWPALAAQKALLCDLPLILAGGLTPENVRMAINAVQPWGVDTASGVELSPGMKDRARVRRFISEARNALPLDIRGGCSIPEGE